jgi:hypothetical protein
MLLRYVWGVHALLTVAGTLVDVIGSAALLWCLTTPQLLPPTLDQAAVTAHLPWPLTHSTLLRAVVWLLAFDALVWVGPMAMLISVSTQMQAWREAAERHERCDRAAVLRAIVDAPARLLAAVGCMCMCRYCHRLLALPYLVPARTREDAHLTNLAAQDHAQGVLRHVLFAAADEVPALLRIAAVASVLQRWADATVASPQLLAALLVSHAFAWYALAAAAALSVAVPTGVWCGERWASRAQPAAPDAADGGGGDAAAHPRNE